MKDKKMKKENQGTGSGGQKNLFKKLKLRKHCISKEEDKKSSPSTTFCEQLDFDLIETRDLKNPSKNALSERIFRRAVASCLSVLMLGAVGALTVGCGANNLNSQSGASEVGLISPRVNDPVILTTESGLEIKYGNANIQPSLASGSLAGFPYFTTNDGTKDYTWVIIGMGVLGLENSSPAGSAIANDTNSSLKRFYGLVSANYIKINNEIPLGCVLVFSNTTFDLGSYNRNYTSKYPTGTSYLLSIYEISTIKTVMNGYYTNGSFGLSSIKDKIVECAVTTQDAVPSSDSVTLTRNTENLYIYPLHGNTAGTFYYGNYISAAQNGHNVWLRGISGTGFDADGKQYYAHITQSSRLTSIGVYTSFYYRPAFCMSII